MVTHLSARIIFVLYSSLLYKNKKLKRASRLHRLKQLKLFPDQENILELLRRLVRHPVFRLTTGIAAQRP